MAGRKSVLGKSTLKTIALIESGKEVPRKQLPVVFQEFSEEVSQIDKQDLTYAEIYRLLNTALALGNSMLRSTIEASDSETTENHLGRSEIAQLKNEILASRILDYVQSQPYRVFQGVDLTFIVMGFQRENNRSLTEGARYKATSVALELLIETGKIKQVAFGTRPAFKVFTEEADIPVENPPKDAVQPEEDIDQHTQLDVIASTEKSSPVKDDDHMINTCGTEIAKVPRRYYDEQLFLELLTHLHNGPVQCATVYSEFVAFSKRYGYSFADSSVRNRYSKTMKQLEKEGVVTSSGFKNTYAYHLSPDYTANPRYDAVLAEALTANDGPNQKTDDSMIDVEASRESAVPQEHSPDEHVDNVKSIPSNPGKSNLTLEADELSQSTGGSDNHPHELGSHTVTTRTSFLPSLPPVIRKPPKREKLAPPPNTEKYLGIELELEGEKGTLLLENGTNFELSLFETNLLLCIMRYKSEGISVNELIRQMQKHVALTGSTLYDSIDELNGGYFNLSSIHILASNSDRSIIRLAAKSTTQEVTNIQTAPQKDAEPQIFDADSTFAHLQGYVLGGEEYIEELDEVIATWTNSDVDTFLSALRASDCIFDIHQVAKIKLVLSSAPALVLRYGLDQLKSSMANSASN